MSWQEYIDLNLIGSGFISEAIILSSSDGVTWASSNNFELGEGELEVLLKSFDDPTSICSNGLYIMGNKYLVLKSDDRSIYARKGSIGICAVRTEQSILLSLYDAQKCQPGDANKTVEQLADYFISVGY